MLVSYHPIAIKLLRMKGLRKDVRVCEDEGAEEVRMCEDESMNGLRMSELCGCAEL